MNEENRANGEPAGYTILPPPLPVADIAGLVSWWAGLMVLATSVAFIPYWAFKDVLVTIAVVSLIAFVMFILAVRIALRHLGVGLALIVAIMMLPLPWLWGTGWKQRFLKLTAHVSEVRILDTLTADGHPAQEILVDWMNTGERPITTVTATFMFVNGSEKKQFEYCIYNGADVRPGQVYKEPKGRGYIWILTPGVQEKLIKVSVTGLKVR